MSQSNRLIFMIAGFSLLISTVFAQIPATPAGAYRIAVLACHRQFEPSPALTHYIAAKPDLTLWIGDNVYADAPNDPAFIQLCYDTLAAKPAFQQLLKSCDYMATWDDHDYGLNDAGKEYRFKKESKAMFRKFWKLEKTIPADQEGIYYARSFPVGKHSVQIIMLDGRYNRDEQDGSGDVLGETQWQWLEQQLRLPADLRIIVSGFQILLDQDAGSETWDKFPKSKVRLFETIRKTGAEQTVFLTGDQHYGEVCRLRNVLDYDAIELQFAGINQIEKAEFNPLRVSPVIKSKHSAAFIDVQMDASKTDVPHLMFHIYDATNDRLELIYRVNLDEISLHLDFSSKLQFTDQHQVILNHSYTGLQLRYTLNGKEPDNHAPLYTGPITLHKTTNVKARFYTRDGEPRSRVFEKTYEKLQPLPAFKPAKSLLPGVTYAYYEGNFEDLPDFKTLTAQKTGVTTTIDLEKQALRSDHFALVYQGLYEMPATGAYDFFTLSDDGSRLYIDDRLVVDNGGSHSLRRRGGLVALEKGLHRFSIEYFDDYSGEKLEFGYLGAANTVQTIKADQMFYLK
ncbi:MAG: alkaline phosphatase D family protein [Saprospiraceae bacterium]|nr:alkaline phosphatase D family protein [Saprospiraceae bacterium]